jgi:hypothetical protein
MNCGNPFMARKANVSRQLQEALGQADVTDRQPSDLVAALYLMQLRAAGRKISTPRRRVAVVTDRVAQVPEPVKIICVDLK